MENELKYEHRHTVDCAQCGEDYRMLNKYGYCAPCYLELSDEERTALGGVQIQQQIVREIPIETTTTVYKPIPGLMHVAVVVVIVSAVVATAVVMLAPRLMGLVSQYLK